MFDPKNQRTISIKQQQAIQKILQQLALSQNNNKQIDKYKYKNRTDNNRQVIYQKQRQIQIQKQRYINNNKIPQLDIQIDQLLKQQQIKIRQQYDLMANQRHYQNRLAIHNNSNNNQNNSFYQLYLNNNHKSNNYQQQSQNKNQSYQQYPYLNNRKGISFQNQKQSSFEDNTYQYNHNNHNNHNHNYYDYDYNIIQKLQFKNKHQQYDNSSNQQSQQKDKSQKLKTVPNSPSYQKQKQKQKHSLQQQSSIIDLNTNYILDIFQKQQIQKIKIRQNQIIQLDTQYPKINYMSMYKNQNQTFQIFNFKQSSAAKWFFRMKKDLSSINQAISFITNVNHGKNIQTIAIHWQIFSIKDTLIIFIGDDWRQPIFVTPQYNNNIKKICISPQKNYLAVALSKQIIIYSIKKQTIVLLKHISQSDLKLQSISHLNFYDDNPIRLCLVDNGQTVALINIQQTLIFTRVKVQQIQHQMKQKIQKILDLSIIKINTINTFGVVFDKATKIGTFGNIGQAITGKINQKIKNNNQKNYQVYLALASKYKVCIYKIQPNIQLISMISISRKKRKSKKRIMKSFKSNLKKQKIKRNNIQKQKQYIQNKKLQTNKVNVRWRKSQNLSKPQLIISKNKTVYIYKLLDDSDSSTLLNKKSQSLQSQQQQQILQDYQGKVLKLHLVFHNHYQILQMEIISDTHMMLKSIQNITVVAIPLIPSTNQALLYNQYDQSDKQFEKINSNNNNNEEDELSDNSQPQQVQLQLQNLCAQSFQSSLTFISSQKNCQMLSCSKQQLLYHIGQNKLQIARLRTLQQQLQQLMIQKGNFRQAFMLLILIYKGLNYSFKFSYKQQDLKKQISAAIQCSLSSILKKTQKSTIRFRVAWMIQILIQTNLQHLIWSLIYQKLRDMKCESVLFQLLQIFLLKSQIRNIPQQVFYPLLKYHCKDYQNNNDYVQNQNSQYSSQEEQIYQIPNINSEIIEKKKKNKQAIAQRIILDNPESYDPMKVLSILHSKKLYYLEFYLFSRGIVCQQNDFYTPFLKVFSAFKQSRKQLLKLTQQQNQKLSQIQIQIPQKLVRNYQKSGLACLWFLRKCFFLQQIPNGPMTIDQKYQIVTNFLIQVMYKTIMIALVQFDQKLFLETFLIPILNLQFQKLIAQNNQQLIHQYIKCNNQPLPFTNFMNILVYCVKKVTIDVLLEDKQEKLEKQKYGDNSNRNKDLNININNSLNINTLVSKIRMKKQYQQQQHSKNNKKQKPLNNNNININNSYNLFPKSQRKQSFSLLSLTTIINLQKIQNNNIRLLFNQFQALSYYVGCNLTFQNIIDILIIFFENHIKQNKLHLPQRMILKPPNFQTLLIKLIQGIRPQLQKSSSQNKFYINKLLSYDDNPISYILYKIDRNYKAAIQQFLRLKPKQQIFNFIKEIIQQIQKKYSSKQDQMLILNKQRRLLQIKQYIGKHISMLFQINRNEALNTFYLLNFSTSQIYKLIQKNMSPKLNFLTSVLQKFQSQDFQMKNQYLLEHLQQVCDLPKIQMLKYLDKFYYPLKEAIYICQQKGNYLAKAIFEERDGCPQQAFKSYQRLIKNKVQGSGYNGNSPGYNKNIKNPSPSQSSNSSPMLKQSPNKIRKQVQQYVQQLLRICKQYSGMNNNSDKDNFWLKIIRLLSSYVQSDHKHKVYLKVQFQRLLQIVLTQMFSFLPTTLLIDFFIKNIRQNNNDLQLSLSRQLSIFQHLIYLVKFDLTIVNKVAKLSTLDLKDNHKIHAIKTRKGIHSLQICDFCKQTLESQCSTNKPCKIFSCKHSFHFICHDDQTKCLSCYYQSDNSIFQGAILTANLYRNSIQNNNIGSKKRRLSSSQWFNIKKQKNLQNSQNNHKNNQINMNNIYVQTFSAAKYQQRKKRLKLYDYEDQCFLNQQFQYNVYDM